MRRNNPPGLIALLLLLMTTAIPAAEAKTLQAVQGDVVKAVIDSPAQSLQCFGKRWPVKKMADGRWHGWVGVDMKQRPGDYDLVWRTASGPLHEKLHVSKGEFRISRITVEKKMAVFDAPTLARIRKEIRELKATYAEPVAADPAISMQQWPIHGIESTPFGAQRYVNGEPRSPHSGIDIAAPKGTLVKAPLGGEVLLVLSMYLNGNTVVIGHGNGLVSVYSHLEFTPLKQGDWIRSGDTIGKVGMTGRATGPHLHWGVRFNQARVNPASLLNQPLP